MKKQPIQPSSEMTISELGTLVVGIAQKIDGLENSIEKLAIMTSNRFDQCDVKFAEIDRRLDNHDERFNDIDETLFRMRGDILNLDERFVTRSEFNNFSTKHA